MPAGVFLGVFATARYPSQTIYLQPGDRLLTYTDGITEAVNESQELFEGHRLLATLKEVRGRTVTEMINAVMAGVKAFTRQAPQSDDITLLALHFKGQPGARN
jgi:sigma-B regulation protein RsbU (phosphoserine phosphatase)